MKNYYFVILFVSISFTIRIAFQLKKEKLFIIVTITISLNYFTFNQFFHFKLRFEPKMINSNFLLNFYLFSQKHY